jgi:hypothetical protein
MMDMTHIFGQAVGVLIAFLPFLLIGGIWVAIGMRRRAKLGRSDKRHSAEEWAQYGRRPTH